MTPDSLETAMAERQHTPGKGSERPKGKRHAIMVESHHAKKASSTGAEHAEIIVARKGSEHVEVRRDRIRVGRFPVVDQRRNVERVERVTVGDALIVDSKPEDVDSSEDDFEIISDLLGGSQNFGSTIKSDLEAHELLNQGLPKAALSSLVDKLHVIEVGEASAALGMSLRTLQRHKFEPAALLDVQQSGRAWKFAEILAKATRVLGSQDEAERWLRHPAIGLDQQRPIDLLTTPAGVKLVEDYLGRLEYNVYT
jgi:putative toxin-antitoxin system antitoxin component (TIGR02293 family)